MNDATNPDGGTTLCHEMACILLECRRDRSDSGVLRPEASHADLADLAAQLARRLAPRIGGRYIPKRDMKAERDAEVIRMWDAGATRAEMVRKLKISRRLTYTITTQETKRRQRWQRQR